MKTFPYHYLLFTLFALLVFYPILHEYLLWRALLDIFLLFTLATCVFAAASNRFQWIVSVILSCFVFFPAWIAYSYPHDWLTQISMIAGCIFFPYIALLLLVDVFMNKSRVTMEMIYGSISIYLLIGLAFAFVYALVFILYPESFLIKEVLQSRGGRGFQEFIYFSFVTMTTLGYGDITPNMPQPAALAYMQAVIGQVYLTVLVARLVGLHISQAKG